MFLGVHREGVVRYCATRTRQREAAAAGIRSREAAWPYSRKFCVLRQVHQTHHSIQATVPTPALTKRFSMFGGLNMDRQLSNWDA